MQNILSDLRDKWEFTHHDRLVKGRGVAAHDTQEGENKQTILYTFLLFLAAVSGDLDFFVAVWHAMFSRMLCFCYVYTYPKHPWQCSNIPYQIIRLPGLPIPYPKKCRNFNPRALITLKIFPNPFWHILSGAFGLEYRYKVALSSYTPVLDLQLYSTGIHSTILRATGWQI